MSLIKISFLCFFLALQGCSHGNNQQTDAAIMTLEKIEQLPLGAPAGEIVRLFGKPTQIFAGSTERNTKNWFYPGEHYNRMVFEVDQTTHQVIMKFWAVLQNDPEQNLDVVLARYPQSHFKRRSSTVSPPHGGLGYDWLEDATSGVSIRIQNKTNKVVSIVWCKEDAKRPCKKD